MNTSVSANSNAPWISVTRRGTTKASPCSAGESWSLISTRYFRTASANPERHEYELYLAVEDIDHTRTKTKSPQTNGICERFHKTVLNEFYRVAFRKKVYRSIEELQADLDGWLAEYNESRPHQGRWCFGKTPMQTFP